MIITLPWPDKVLFPNAHRGRHWATYQRAKVSARMDGFMAAKQAIGRASPATKERMPVRITFHMPNRIRRDWDGMAGAIKHHIDGIAKALDIDDSAFRPISIDVDLDPDKRGYVIVEVGI